MNRRSFFRTIGTLAAGFSILPGALTYTRQWKQHSLGYDLWVPDPNYLNAPLELAVYQQPTGLHTVLITRTSWDHIGLVGERILAPYPPRFNSWKDWAQGHNIPPYTQLRSVE